MKKILKREIGITLIALIITVLIMLILAGVAISILTTDGGLFDKTKTAVEKYNNAVKAQDEKISILMNEMNTYFDKYSGNEEQKYLTSISVTNNKITEGSKISVKISSNKNEMNNIVIKLGTETIYSENINSKNYSKTLELANLNLSTLNFNEDYELSMEITDSLGKIEVFKGDNKVKNYTIHNAAGLKKMATDVEMGTLFESETILLLNDIDLSEVCSETLGSWKVIGNITNPFKGTFNGNGKTISNLYINGIYGYRHIGLFGAIANVACVKNIVLTGNLTADYYVGGIVGTNLGLIENCSNFAVVNYKLNEEYNYSWITGGVCGLNKGTISKCINNATVNGYDSVGGIAGINEGTIKYCINKGDISSDHSSVGGLAGINGYVTDHVTDTFFHGVGYIYNSYNTGKIDSVSYNYIKGGITGINGYNKIEAKSYIYNCYSRNTETIAYEGEEYHGEIINCHTVKTTADILNSGIDTVNGTDTEQPWVSDNTNINDGYPILSWEIES